MFITLLSVTFLLALFVSFLVIVAFKAPIARILKRITADEISAAWLKYLNFAMLVVGTSSGVRLWELERYITPRTPENGMITLNTDRWVLEIYRTILSTLAGIAWLLLVFFVVALIAYVIVRAFESRKTDAK